MAGAVKLDLSVDTATAGGVASDLETPRSATSFAPSPGALGSVTTCNTATKDGDCWIWELTLQADVHVDGVTARLHPTFKPNVVSMTARPDGSFTCGELRGWGTFPIGLQLTVGSQTHAIEHMLSFEEPENVLEHELSALTVNNRERRKSAESASATWRPPPMPDPAEAKRQKEQLKLLKQAQRELQKTQGRGADVASHAAAGSSAPKGTQRKRARDGATETAPRRRGPKLTAQEKQAVTATARALVESISELAEAGDAAGVAKACALLHEDCIEAFAESNGDDYFDDEVARAGGWVGGWVVGGGGAYTLVVVVVVPLLVLLLVLLAMLLAMLHVLRPLLAMLAMLLLPPPPMLPLVVGTTVTALLTATSALS